MQVSIALAISENKRATQQVWIDCNNNKKAIGECYIFVDNAAPQRMDYSNNGWLWIDLKDTFDKKLKKLICK